MSEFCPHDPFRENRRQHGALVDDFIGEFIPMIRRHKHVRGIESNEPRDYVEREEIGIYCRAS